MKRHTEKLWFTPEDREKTLEKIKRKKEKEAEEEVKKALVEPEAKDEAEPNRKRKKAGEIKAEAPKEEGKLPAGIEMVDCGGKGDCGFTALGWIKQTIEARKNGTGRPDPTNMNKMKKIGKMVKQKLMFWTTKHEGQWESGWRANQSASMEVEGGFPPKTAKEWIQAVDK